MSVPVPGGEQPVPPARGADRRVLGPRRRFALLDLPELWRYRELFLQLALRDVLVRYKQAFIGILWAVIQPVVTMVIFTVIFGGLAKLPSDGVPYPVLTLAGLLPWQLFASTLQNSSNIVVGNAGMITKIYFPRIILPVSSALSAVVDFLVALGVLLGMMAWYRVPLTGRALLLPAFFLLALLAALALGLWLGALNVKYRDVRHVVPFLIRIGMYASPVGFATAVIPERFRFFYALNPMAGAIDGFRWCLLSRTSPPLWTALAVSALGVLLLLVSGAWYFRRTERIFADVI